MGLFDRTGGGTRFRRLRRAAAALAAIATLAAGGVAFADGGHGNGNGNGSGGEQGDVRTRWIYAENYGTPTVQNVKNAIANAGSRVSSNMDGVINSALMQAQQELAARGGSNGRIVGIGYTTFNNTVTTNATYSDDNYAKQQYGNAWSAETHGKNYNYRGINYTVASPFTDAPSRNVDSIAGEGINSATRSTEIIVLILAQNEPRNPEYHLSVTTSAANGNAKAGSTDAVHDHIAASIGAGEQWTGGPVNADVWLNWDGYPATASQHRNAKKTVRLTQPGQFDSPSFTPADFGWREWPAGRYWFDIDVPKQGAMAEAVNTSDRQSSEQWTLAEPPTVKTLSRINGQPLDGTQLTAGMPYMAHVTAHAVPAAPGYDTVLTLRDKITVKDVWIGANDHDDASKATVTGPDGKTVAARITVSDTGTGRTVQAVIDDPVFGRVHAQRARLPEGRRPRQGQAGSHRGHPRHRLRHREHGRAGAVLRREDGPLRAHGHGQGVAPQGRKAGRGPDVERSCGRGRSHVPSGRPGLRQRDRPHSGQARGGPRPVRSRG